MYSEFWSNKAPQASGNATEMLRELVRIGFEQAVARAEASARMARNLAGCRTPLDAIAVYQDWMVNESQRVVADMRRMAELTRTLLQQSGDVAMLGTPVGPVADSGAMAKAAGQSAPEPKPAQAEVPAAQAGHLPAAKAEAAPASLTAEETNKAVRKPARRKQPSVAES